MTTDDPLAPTRTDDDPAAGAIACVTLITAEPERTAAFYERLMGMERMVPDAPTDPDHARALWALPADFDYRETWYRRAGHPELPLLRVLQSSADNASLRPDYEARLEGGLSVGFAVRDIAKRVEDGADNGFPTSAGVVTMQMARPDGTPYDVSECHFLAPDDVYALGVERPPDLAQVCAIDEGAAVGGPAYTGQVINHCDDTLAFYTNVLGYEVRRRMPIGGPDVEKGLGLPPGTTFEFLQVFAPGSSAGYFIVLDFADAGLQNPNLAPPHRGVVGWTIPVRNAADVARGATDANATVIAGPAKLTSPAWGEHYAVSVRTANGFIVECVQIA